MTGRPSLPPADPLARGRLEYRQHGIGIELEVAHGLFSATTVDSGTRFLLRWLGQRDDLGAEARILDLGCGYGPLAVWLAAAGAGRVEAVDRDAAAVEWTSRNAAANGVGDRVVTGASLGYDDVEGGPYDLVVSNVPAKAGPAALEHVLLDAGPRMAPGGTVAVVVVDGLAAEVRSVLASVPTITVVEEHANRGYLQVTYRFDAPGTGDAAPGFDRGVYGRGQGRFAAGGVEWAATTVRTLPEFDTLGHGTAAAVDLLAARRPAGPVAVVGVGQGHVSLALAALGATGGLALVDRDLLALRAAAANLPDEPTGAPVVCSHVAHPMVPVGTRTAVVGLPEKEPVAVSAALLGPALAGLEPEGTAVLHGRSADVSRVVELLSRHGPPWREVERTRRRAHAAVRLRRR